MDHTLSIVYSEKFQQYDFGPSHPLKPTRLKLTFELMRSLGLLTASNVAVEEPRMASREELRLFHSEEYLQLVEQMSRTGSGLLDMGDTPAFKGCFDASALAVGASLTAVDLVMSRKSNHAMNIAGGLHHAHPDRASGFCVFNDPAVAIAYLKEKYHVQRILYLDVDAHHGDGVMYGFYDDPALLDIDFHEDGRHLFPGTGFISEIGEGKGSGFKINIPLPPFMADDGYLKLFGEIVPKAVRKFRPEILLMQCGADSHANDLLAHLRLTSKTYREATRIVDDLSHEVADSRLILFGGGGYNPANVARTWTLVAGTSAGYLLPNEIPEGWRKLFEALIGESAPTTLDSQYPYHDLSDEFTSEAVNSILNDLRGRINLLA
jgi:acetoin utilization protein AcuC